MINKPKYPKLDCKLDKRRKLCPKDIEQIRTMRKSKVTWSKITQIYGISETTLYYILFPDKKIEMNKKINKINTERYHNDPKFRKKIIESSKQIVMNRYREDPEFRKYHSEQSKLFYYENRGNDKI